MSKLQIQIGTDTSIDTTEEGYEGGNAVMIESHNGTVCITGPFEGWMGYQELADLPIEQADEADALARKIAASPAAELTALGYDIAGWFEPLQSDLWMVEQSGEPIPEGAFKTEAEALRAVDELATNLGWDRETLSVEHYTGDKAAAYAAGL